MSPHDRDIRRIAALGGACAIGSVLTPILPPLGLPVVGASLARLRYRFGSKIAVAVAIVSAALATLLLGEASFARLADAVTVVAAVVLALVLARRLVSMSPGLAVIEAVVVMTIAVFGAQALGAWMSGTTVVAEARAAAEASAALTFSVFGGSSVAIADSDVASLADFLFRAWPADYLFNAVVSSILLVVAIGWVGHASGVSVRRLPALPKIDLDPRILWFPVGAVALMIAGRLVAQGEVLETAGLNILLATRPLFLWQGLGVVAGRASSAGVKMPARVVLYACVLILDLLFLATSVVGLLDMRFNFRRLARADDPSGRPLERESGM
ncbi:MAG: DUF2232 domain-containing protein [Coriobacteriia bacterium]|nr:DUF2232 domain-containing protein [Coriobacteriia bacterium]